MSHLTPQAKKVLSALMQKRLVTRLTMMHLGVMNLTARITEIRGAGYNVECENDVDIDGNRFGKFKLAKKKQAPARAA
jgi:hypothetical protein